MIQATTNHPFYTRNRGWVEAGNLQEGEELYNNEGSIVILGSKKIIELEEEITVYNFEVENWHTYFVGSEKILVHNECGAGIDNLVDGYVDEIFKDGDIMPDQLDDLIAKLHAKGDTSQGKRIFILDYFQYKDAFL